MLWTLLTLAAVSPWSPAEWRINLNIGREPGTYMPPEWGASLGRLALPVEILVESETVSASDVQAERDFMGGSGKCDRLSVLVDPVFVSTRGEETVEFADQGAWKILTRRTGKPGDAATLRFWLEVSGSKGEIAAQRNDVALMSERLYCTANCWRESELEAGLRRMRPIQAALDEAQAVVAERLSHETGDRRLDGTNPVDLAMASVDMAVLVKTRDDRLNEMREAERRLPFPSTELSAPGNWPGSTEKLIIAKGKIGVKRKEGGLFGGEEVHIIGTWTASPLETDTEYYDDVEEEAGSTSE
jgi:hypothetical protein